MTDDPALKTLMLPFATGALAWPVQGQVLFLKARAMAAVRGLPKHPLVCEQSFKPFADGLARAGIKSAPAVVDEGFAGVLLLVPRQREEARASMARAVACVASGGFVAASMLNTEGARTGEAALGQLVGDVHSLSKNKCRVFWATVDERAKRSPLVASWTQLDAPRLIADSGLRSRPGLFAWDRIDVGSSLLAEHLPTDLAGRGADLGAGVGYLSAQALARCSGIVALDIYEAEARALELARSNLSAEAERLPLGFFWHDVTVGLPQRYDFIVSNPPFHQGRADQPDLGRAFIAAAAAALVPGGRLCLVANRHLPYEGVLADNFASVRTVVEARGFKVLEAVKAA
jgi:16S rRNA (guanine1207-N2)-methyltransferase